MYPSPIDNYSVRTTQQVEATMPDPLLRSQLRRHMSTSSQQKRLSRISKPSSAGNSPQDIQKRRSQPISRQRRAYYQQCIQDPTPATQFIQTSRPFSWHPSTMAGQHLTPSYIVNGIPTPLPNPVTHLEPKGYYNSEDPSGFYQQSADYDVQGNTDVDSMMQGGYSNTTYQRESSAVFSPILYSGSTLPGSFSTYNTHTAPATPDFYSITQTTNTSQGVILPRTDSKELVGMGLYDGPDRNSWTLDSYMEYDHTMTRPLSLGKGLKLEETWEPPEDEDKTDDEDDEDESQDQVEETIQEQLEQVTRQASRLSSMGVTNQPFYYNSQDVITSRGGLIQQMAMASYGMVL